MRELATRYGVSRVSIYNASNHGTERQEANASRSRVVGVRVSDRDLRGFDAALGRRCIRASMGDKVFRLAPTDWDRPTHRYNPLARIAAMTNPDRQQMELKLTC